MEGSLRFFASHQVVHGRANPGPGGVPAPGGPPLNSWMGPKMPGPVRARDFSVNCATDWRILALASEAKILPIA